MCIADKVYCDCEKRVPTEMDFVTNKSGVLIDEVAEFKCPQCGRIVWLRHGEED